MYRKAIWMIATFAGITLLAYIHICASMKSLRLAGTGAGNATLGFGGIFVLTENAQTWRVQGLHKAAELAGLDLIVTIQGPRSVEDVTSYLRGDELEQHVDAVKATMNYIALLQVFVEKGYDTGLFFEDDVDFGVMIRLQTKLLADSLSKLPQNSTTDDPYSKGHWDILWLGHYGIQFTDQTRISYYHDPYALSWRHLTSDFNNYYQQMQSAEAASDLTQQQVAYGVAPMGTYAWAITRGHAQWLVQELTSTRAQVFDVRLHVLCRGLRQRCVAPVPELLHHQQVAGSKSIGKQGVAPGNEELSWWRTVDKSTQNIAWSARCTSGKSGKRFGDLWKCLPPI